MDEIKNVAAEKARARALFRARRAALAPEARAEQSTAICARLRALVRDSNTVSAFWPLADEVDLRAVIWELAATGARVALPRVLSAPGASPCLEHRLFAGDGALVRGRFGVMEPAAAAPLVTPSEIDLALVPALAADARGTRLGYGGGFYDAFLTQTGALRVAVIFASGVADYLPAEPHDARVDAVVTPEATLWTGRLRNPSERET